ncbi:MAG: DPP IV N-terminal domain-containing protein [Bacteroidaceae bacterium]|nr:DPP IV N-terminal domain-containing protein [Bacteroidaceae bacterium]
MRKTSLFLLLLTLTLSLAAQGTLDDYNRAYSMRQRFGSDKVLNANIEPHWVGDSHSFWYILNTSKGNDYLLLDADKGTAKPLFDAAKLAKLLSKETKQEVKAERLDLQRLRVSDKGDTLRFFSAGKSWTYLTKKNTLRSEEMPSMGRGFRGGTQRHWSETDDEKGGNEISSPDGKWAAFIRDGNVWVRPAKGGQPRALSNDGTLGSYYSSWMRWSPDSKYIAVNKIRPVAEKRYVYYVESSPADQLQPKLHKQEYAKPGDELTQRTPCIFEVETGRSIVPSTELFTNQYDLNGPVWNDDSRSIRFEYNARGHQVYRLLELSAETGEVRTLAEETSDKYVNYPRLWNHFLKDGKRFIWSSERDGYQHLYLYDRATGKPLNQITKGKWYVRQVVHVDEENETFFFTANGVHAAPYGAPTGEDPYNIHYYSIRFDGTGLTDLTPDEGHHRASYSVDRKYLVDTWSTPSQAPQTVVRRTSDGSVVKELAKADISRLVEAGWTAPEVFVAPGRDGKTQMWGMIARPTHFDPTKRYPIIEYIYQGPGDQYVPKSFQAFNYYMTPLAELGFIVVMVDGMGTSFRSREFENICWHNLKDAGIPDHIAWIKAAADKYPYMDIERVGIYGCSAGGQESLTATLLHPEFYKCCYSACGCHDNRMDKIWWNELWMGYPVGEQYKESSNVEMAHLLQRPLMLVVGELDDNVDPASTMQVADALIKANKEFELVVIPGAHHTVGEAYGEHKRYDFFVRHLLGVTPPSWAEVKTR